MNTTRVSAQTLGDTFVNGGLEVQALIDFHQFRSVPEATDFDVRLINDAPRNLSLIGDFTLKGGFELGDSLVERGTPFIDFHYGAGRTSEDFNVRLINESDHWLVLRGGNLSVDGTIKVTSLELTSDRNAKAGFQAADSEGILAKVAELPISTWQYTNAPDVRHVGPTAQDFKAAFGFGAEETRISVVDGLGVALAAIQGLKSEADRKDAEIKVLKGEILGIRQQMQMLKEAPGKTQSNTVVVRP